MGPCDTMGAIQDVSEALAYDPLESVLDYQHHCHSSRMKSILNASC